jgi:hypothetical protein
MEHAIDYASMAAEVLAMEANKAQYPLAVRNALARAAAEIRRTVNDVAELAESSHKRDVATAYDGE